MKHKAYYSANPVKQIVSLIIMLIVSVIVVFGSVAVSNAVEKNNSKSVDLDFTVTKTIPYTLQRNKLGITEVEKAFDSQNNLVAYVITGTAVGYNTQTPIKMATTVTADGKVVCGVEIISQAETEYLGVRIVTDDFKNQFVNKKLPVSASNSLEKGSKIDMIAKSTISSQAVIDGVNNAAEYVNAFLLNDEKI